MTDNVGGQRCSCFYCHCPATIGGHNEGCPILDPSGVAMDDWNRGYDYGLDDQHIRSHQYSGYPAALIMGWSVGKAKIDQLVEDAYYSNYGYELDHDEDGNAIW